MEKRTRVVKKTFVLLCVLAGTPAWAQKGASPFDALAKTYAGAVKQINEVHARQPGKALEPELAKRMPAQAKGALEKLLKAKDAPELFEALVACGESALDLDLMVDFQKIRGRLEKSSPEHAKKLGTALSRPRFLLRALGGLDAAYLEKFAEVFQAVLEAYDEVFGFAEWSKVPGKKLRVRIHLEEKIVKPPHFAPQFAYHSEIDFPVIDATAFKSPTADGKFLFYGLCHELGHVIAMWGNTRNEEDHHSWAHYTGVVIVEHLSENAKDKAFMKDLLDVRWRSLTEEKKNTSEKKPSLADADGVLAMLIALHEKVGPKAIGTAINFLDRQDKRLRVNRVRYYSFKELREALLATLKSPQDKKAAAAIIPAGP